MKNSVNTNLLILDEVQCGIGRTGKFLAFEHAKIKPDIVPIAKKYNKKIFPLEPLLVEASLSSKLTGELFNGLWIDVGTQERLNKAENLTLSKETSS